MSKSDFYKWFNPFDENLGPVSKVEAIEYTWKEQQKIIDKLRGENQQLRKEFQEISDELERLKK